MGGVVIVGAGHAGTQLAFSLRERGYDGPLSILGAEPHLPYQRPPLSKAVLRDRAAARTTPFRPGTYYEERGIELLLDTTVVQLEREERAVVCADGRRLGYDHLVLATGARNRRLPGVDGVLQLRTLGDALAIESRLQPGTPLVVIGGGFIGLELAAAARERRVDVTVVEVADRMLARAVSPAMSEALHAEHTRRGVRILLGRRVAQVASGHVELADGERIAAQVAVAGVGVEPETALAERGGLAVSDGILVDGQLLSSDERISAVGDCARFRPADGATPIRLESIQNATDHARHVAARLVGETQAAYAAVPWFWSEQYGRRLQIAGLGAGDDVAVRRDARDGSGFSIFRFAQGRLVAVESLDRPREHLAARRLLAAGGGALTPRQAADLDHDLRALVAPAA